jgi:hypothetical protein
MKKEKGKYEAITMATSSKPEMIEVKLSLTITNFTLATKAAEIFQREVGDVILAGGLESGDFEDYDSDDALVEVLYSASRGGWCRFDSFSDAMSLARRYKAAQPQRKVAVAPWGGDYYVEFVLGSADRPFMLINGKGENVPEFAEIL